MLACIDGGIFCGPALLYLMVGMITFGVTRIAWLMDKIRCRKHNMKKTCNQCDAVPVVFPDDTNDICDTNDILYHWDRK